MSSTDARSRLREAQGFLSPKTVRERAVVEFDELFRSGAVPEPPPEGFLSGSLITSTTWDSLDLVSRRLAELYMPWLGKSFDPASNEGVNVLKRSAVTPMRALWPSYKVLREYDDRVEAFRFRTRIDTGAVDPSINVLKIDYDFDANPDLLIRKILDELVQIDDGLYLGKVLYRGKGGYRPIGYFSLER
ncbi:MAG: hypothetical protein ACRDKZ_11080 [Actinomycetota bacterium]